MKAGHAIPGPELPHALANTMHDAGDIVAAVGVVPGDQVRDLPVLGVGAGADDADDELVGAGDGEGDGVQGAGWAGGYVEGLHGLRHCRGCGEVGLLGGGGRGVWDWGGGGA